MIHVIRFLIWLLPASAGKNRTLSLLGHRVHPTATAKASLVWRVEIFIVAEGGRIGRGNVFKNMRQVTIGKQASLGRLNVISAHPAFARYYRVAGVFEMAESSTVTSRHQVDCSGGCFIGALSCVAGHQTRIMTHSIDVLRDAQAAYPVRIGERSFVGARCLILGGAVLPDRSVLAGGSVLPQSSPVKSLRGGLWAGTPAEHKRDIAEGAWFDRTATSTTSIYVPETGETVAEAF